MAAELIRRGALRTTVDSLRPHAARHPHGPTRRKSVTAAAGSHRALRTRLAPPPKRLASPTISALDQHLSEVIDGRIRGRLYDGRDPRELLRYPSAAVLHEAPNQQLWFPVPGFYGGFLITSAVTHWMCGAFGAVSSKDRSGRTWSPNMERRWSMAGTTDSDGRYCQPHGRTLLYHQRGSTKVACDALLIPTDSECKIEDHWLDFLEFRTYTKPHSWKLGDVFVSVSDATPHVWLGNIGQPTHGAYLESFAPTVEAFPSAMATLLDSIDAAGARICAWPKLRLAVNVVGSGAGGGIGMKGNLTLGLVQTLSDLASTHDVDIVLVTWGEKAYAAAQRARRQVIGTNERETWKFHERANPELIHEARTLADEARMSQTRAVHRRRCQRRRSLPTWATAQRRGEGGLRR